MWCNHQVKSNNIKTTVLEFCNVSKLIMNYSFFGRVAPHDILQPKLTLPKVTLNDILWDLLTLTHSYESLYDVISSFFCSACFYMVHHMT